MTILFIIGLILVIRFSMKCINAMNSVPRKKCNYIKWLDGEIDSF